MRHARRKTIAVAVIVLCQLTAGTGTALADPAEPVPVDSSSADGGGPLAGPLPGPAVSAAPDDSVVPPDTVAAACKQFDAALNLASSNYEDFAYASAGGGNFIDYQDPNVARTALIARTALRESATAAASSAQTPGLPQEVADPMRSWSLRATKLSLLLSLRGGGDSMNSTVNDLNTDGHNAQLACATAVMHG